MNEVIQTLRYGGLRVRTALWLLPLDQLTRLPDSAARLGIHLVDVRQPLLDTIAPDQRFLSLRLREFVNALDTLCKDSQASDCLLVTNCDLIIAKLTYRERKDLWETLHSGFPNRSRALLIVMPDSAAALLPTQEQLNLWEKEGRLVP